MPKTILFSPIGGNDPVSSANEADGSMLHICRHYKPDVVYLYLSAEMVERSRNDNRYRYCIQKLGEKIGHNFEVHQIERETLEDVHEYDFYYKEFREIIDEIQDHMETEDRLLINIASGTPAMKSELLVAAVLSEFHIIPIQVITPTRRINTHKGEDADYDPEYYWELDKDNEEGSENRCIEVKCPNLVATIKKNIIMRHVNSYDYTAALSLAHEISGDLSEKTIDLIELAIARQQLDLSKVAKIENKYGFHILKQLPSDQKYIFEYGLTLGIKLERKEYADFIRAISPLLTDLFTDILKAECGIDITNYCVQKYNVMKLSDRKLSTDSLGRELLSVLNSSFSNSFRESPLAASNLEPLLRHYIKDTKVLQDIVDIREIEEKARNIAAHEIISINDDSISKILGRPITMQQIYGIIKRLIVRAKIKITRTDWDAYNDMNQIITEELL
ncbi:MAG: CRISPR-associated protein Csm6 [Parasporobacterium sp.]|nr:CRISPR-associated protein Csm6 [Parasporobacterium sp.]